MLVSEIALSATRARCRCTYPRRLYIHPPMVIHTLIDIFATILWSIGQLLEKSDMGENAVERSTIFRPTVMSITRSSVIVFYRVDVYIDKVGETWGPGGISCDDLHQRDDTGNCCVTYDVRHTKSTCISSSCWSCVLRTDKNKSLCVCFVRSKLVDQWPPKLRYLWRWIWHMSEEFLKWLRNYSS